MEEVLKVTKVFTFDMAHALMNYDGPCKNIHGHTYSLYITLKGPVSVTPNLAKDGMVLDFGLLKDIVKTEVLNVFDHALVLNKEAEYVKEKRFLKQFEKVILTDYQPTCEQLLLDIKNRIQPKIPKHLQLFQVRLDETPTSFAEWCISDTPKQN